jgi:hypothetical protein
MINFAFGMFFGIFLTTVGAAGVIHMLDGLVKNTQAIIYQMNIEPKIQQQSPIQYQKQNSDVKMENI